MLLSDCTVLYKDSPALPVQEIQTTGIKVHLIVSLCVQSDLLCFLITNIIAIIDDDWKKPRRSGAASEAYIELNLRIQKGVGFRLHDKWGDFTPLTISSVMGHGHLLSPKSIRCNPPGGKIRSVVSHRFCFTNRIKDGKDEKENNQYMTALRWNIALLSFFTQCLEEWEYSTPNCGWHTKIRADAPRHT